MEVIEIIMYLIMYDINTETSEGKKRLRNIAQYCLIYSQRVQNSVYECNVAEHYGTKPSYDLDGFIAL